MCMARHVGNRIVRASIFFCRIAAVAYKLIVALIDRVREVVWRLDRAR